MRHLLDTYIRAEDSEKLSAFDDMSLVELLVDRGEDAVNALPDGIRENPEAVAETIENNVRKVIIDEMAVNPKYYERMSELLDALIRQRKHEAMEYKAYLAQIVALTKKLKKPETASYPTGIDTPALRALFDNLAPASTVVADDALYAGADQRAETALDLDRSIRNVKKEGWRHNKFKRMEVRIAIKSVLGDNELVDVIFNIVESRGDY
jgi:type I restriction enzyme, R subunit